MEVIVCGAGRVGGEIAAYLSGEGNSVTVIDHSHERIEKLNDNMDVKAILGYSSQPTVLEEAGAKDAEMIIAVTLSDEINMIACQVAHSLFGVKLKIARIRNQNYLSPKWAHLYSPGNLPIDVIISPELEVAQNIINRLHMPGAIDSIPIAADKVRIIAVKINDDCPLLNSDIKDAQEILRTVNARIIAIIRDDDFMIVKDSDFIRSGDVIYYISDCKNKKKTIKKFGHNQQEASKITIVGGGTIGSFLASSLEKDHDTKIKIIEVEKERALEIAEDLEKTTVINGDALDQEILQEISIEKSDTIITVSNDDEVNILSSLLAKRMGCKQAISLANNEFYVPLAPSIGIDVVINPREVTISTILQYIRKGNIKEVYSIANSKAEIIETQITKHSYLNGKKIRDLKLDKGIDICAIIRGDCVIIADRDVKIQTDDLVVAVSLFSCLKKVDKLFSAKDSSYF